MISHHDGAPLLPGPLKARVGGSPQTFEDLCEDVGRDVLPPLQGLPAALHPVLANLAQKANALPDLAELLPLPWQKLNKSSRSGRRPSARQPLPLPRLPDHFRNPQQPWQAGRWEDCEKILEKIKQPRRLDQHGSQSPSMGFPFLYQIPRYDGKDAWKIRRDP